MKNLLIIYNVIFFLLGNVLISSVHHSLDHHYDHLEHHDYDCQECMIIESSNNYASESNEVNFSNSSTDVFILEYFHIIEFNANKIYLSRAPPIS